jgi:acyl-CoA synthetase (AMP-forming)/AMP-acid ligase II
MLTWPDSSLDPQIVTDLTGRGAPFELVREIVLDAEMDVFAERPRTMVDVLRSGADQFRDEPYAIFTDRTLTFSSIIEPVAAVATNLSEHFGVCRGDRVAIASANRAEYLLTFWAATALGAITVALNGWWTGPEMRYGIDLTEPKVLLGDDRRLSRLSRSDFGKMPIVDFDDGFADLEKGDGAFALPEVSMEEDDPYVILFTSGTTGRAKGAVISHRGTIHFGMATQLRGAVQKARVVADSGHAAPTVQACSVTAFPMFHVSGLTCTLALAPMTGMRTVLAPPGRWSEETHLQLTVEHRATSWSVVPTQLWRLLEWPHLHEYDLSTLRGLGGGGAVWPPELLRKLEIELPWVRPAISVSYGMTETNGHGVSLDPTGSYSHPDSVGRPSPTVEVDVRDPLTRGPLPEGEVGEITLRTPASFLGYWADPDATANCFDRDRWYHTGDFGRVRDGFVFLAGRRSDLIVRGGENIYPVEIENRLFEHPDIIEAAVMGVDHATLGQEVKAYVVRRPSARLSEADVASWCRQTLASFKVPTHVEFLPELPHNATGKVLKHELENRASSGDVFRE